MPRELKYRIRLKLLIDEWGSVKKGDIKTYFFNLLDEINGLARFSIDKHWEILSCDEFTGKIDINDEDVYTGDIIESTYYKHATKNLKLYQKVIFGECGYEAKCLVNREDLEFETTYQHCPLNWVDKIEVIDNIYENKLNLMEI